MLASRYRQVTINLLIWHIVFFLNTLLASSEETTRRSPDTKSSCSIYKYLGVNDLSINDIVVKNSMDNMVCIKARFSLAIKVEAALENTLGESNDVSDMPGTNDTNSGDKRIILGYLPLDSVVNVEDSCTNSNPISQKNATDQDKSDHTKSEEPRELDMIVTFECGKLAFTFKRDNDFYLSSIKGVVNLDSNTIREFISDRPMCYTSDLNHYFKYNDLIEVNSVAETKAFILTANLYHSEFEAFRTTSSRAFVRQPDDQSKPFR